MVNFDQFLAIILTLIIDIKFFLNKFYGPYYLVHKIGPYIMNHNLWSILDLCLTHRCPEMSIKCLKISSEHGQLDALFNNAGILGAGKIGELDSASFDELVAVNLKSPIFLSQGEDFLSTKN